MEGPVGHTEIRYPLSGADSVWSALLIVAIYTLPLFLLLGRRLLRTSLFLGLATAAGGCYLSYLGQLTVTKLMIGWYINAGGLAIYAIASMTELWLSFRPRGKLNLDESHGVNSI